MNADPTTIAAIEGLSVLETVRAMAVASPALSAIVVGLVAVMAIDLLLGAPWWAMSAVSAVTRRSRTEKARKISEALRGAAGPRFAVIVGPIRRDRDDALSDLVDRAVKDQMGTYLFDREVLAERAPLDLVGARGGDLARSWIDAFGVELVVWGEGGKGPLHRIFFMTRKSAANGEPVQEIRLAPPGRDGGSAADVDRLAAGVAYIFARTALPTAHDADRYRVEKLLPLLDAVGALAHEPPAGLGPAFEQVLRADAATIALSVGRRTKNADELRRASRLRVRILAEIDRATHPSDWAVARAEAARVQLALGRLELDDKRLAAAATAFAEAVEQLGGEEHRAARARALLDLAHAASERAKLGEPGSRYAEAAKAYRGALRAAPEDEPRFLDDARRGLAGALHALSEIDGDDGSLRQAVDAYRDARTDRLRAVDAEAWATTSHRLGDALATLAARHGDPALYDESVRAYDDALKERTRDAHPKDWAKTWAQLGHVFLGMGKSKPDMAALNASVDAFRNALKEVARDDAPDLWSSLHNNLGNAHQAVGEATGERSQLVSAVTAYRNAIEHVDKHASPFEWAGVQNNLGNALHVLGEKSQGVEALEAALAAHRNALSVRTKEASRVEWAATRNNMGLVLSTLGARLRDPGRLEEAIRAYRDAVGVFRMAGEVRYAVMAERNLDRAKLLLDESRRMAAE